MATSRSGKKSHRWTAGAFLFSGRPDPTWDVSEEVAKTLQELWKSLSVAEQQSNRGQGGLGYRGSFLRGADREWVVFKGLVSLKAPEGLQVRKDAATEFERALLASAPKGLLPEGLISAMTSL